MSEETTVQETEEIQDSFEFAEEANADTLNIDELTRDNFTQEQPPQEDGEQTLDSDDSEANESNEDGEGSETPTNTEDQETTALSDGEGEQSDKEKASEGKWSEEQQKYFTDKGLEEIPYSESTATLLKNTQEAEKRITESSQTVSNRNAEMAAIAGALHSGDVKTLQQFAKELGGELEVDARTQDDIMKEVTDNYNGVYEAVNPAIESVIQKAQELAGSSEQYSAKDIGTYLNQVAEMFTGGLNSLHSKANGTIQDIKRKQEIRDEVARASGKPIGQKTSLYDNWSRNAENAFTELRKLDPQTDKYVEALKEEIGEGSAFEAAGINMAKMFGHGPTIAKTSYKLGKALALLKEHESGDLEKGFYEKFKKENKGRIGQLASGKGGLLGEQQEQRGGIDHNKWLARATGLQ